MAKESSIITYIMVWIHETEKWHYFKESFDEKQFENGYVAYFIKVKDGIIISDTFHNDNVNHEFNGCYNAKWWNSMKKYMAWTESDDNDELWFLIDAESLEQAEALVLADKAVHNISVCMEVEPNKEVGISLRFAIN